MDVGRRAGGLRRESRTASSCCSAASCRCSSGPRKCRIRPSGQACRSRSGRRRSATPRSAPVSSPGNQGSDGWNGWKGKLGVDARWEHCLVVVDAEGNITEEWTQWDELFRRPHSVTINPYDPEKHVWVVDDRNHAVYKFTHDGKQLVQTLGVPGVAGNDATHFNRPTFLAWLPDSTMFVSDGYANTRVVKFDKDGKFLMEWGEKGTSPNDTRPGTFNAVHGVRVDPDTRRVYVTDRSNHRIQVFDENGKYLDQFSDRQPSTPQVLYLSADRNLWIADNAHSKIVEVRHRGPVTSTRGAARANGPARSGTSTG